VTEVAIPGLAPDVQARAGLSNRQAECLSLHLRGASYRVIGAALGIDYSTAHGHVQRGLRRLELAMRPDVDEPAQPAKPRRAARRSHTAVGPNPFAT
jgi:DNA-binding CsgD family transcriptional regulator